MLFPPVPPIKWSFYPLLLRKSFIGKHWKWFCLFPKWGWGYPPTISVLFPKEKPKKKWKVAKPSIKAVVVWGGGVILQFCQKDKLFSEGFQLGSKRGSFLGYLAFQTTFAKQPLGILIHLTWSSATVRKCPLRWGGSERGPFLCYHLEPTDKLKCLKTWFLS